MTENCLLDLLNIEKNYGGTKVLKKLNIRVKSGEIMCVLGPSGCGKSTLLNIISGLIKIDKGKVINNSHNTSYIFQEDRLLPWKNVYENIKVVNKNVPHSKLMNLIKVIGLKGFEGFYPDEISGGMRQRCSIARAFNYYADLLLMDEPFKSLDYNLRIEMIHHLISFWKNTNKTIIFVTHEIDEALLLGDRIFLLSNRPTIVQKEFAIDEEKFSRKLTNNNLIRIRNEIIEIMESY